MYIRFLQWSATRGIYVCPTILGIVHSLPFNRTERVDFSFMPYMRDCSSAPH
jgi:hypothetical protein